MNRRTRLPIRLRLTIIFAASMAAVVAGLGVFVYARMGADLLSTVDAGLRSRAELLAADLQQDDPALVNVEPTLIESDEVFAQIADASGRTIQSSSRISRWRLLPLACTIPARAGALRQEDPRYRQSGARARRAGEYAPRALCGDGRGIP